MVGWILLVWSCFLQKYQYFRLLLRVRDGAAGPHDAVVDTEPKHGHLPHAVQCSHGADDTGMVFRGLHFEGWETACRVRG